MRLVCGVDAGSRAVKVALLDAANGTVIASTLGDQVVDQAARAVEMRDRLLREVDTDSDAILCTIATGYGRHRIDFADATITEISCHAAGIHHLQVDAATIIDIGGQDSKVIRLGRSGAVEDFAMNDRCAAGTGRFLEMVADRLEVRLDQLGDLARRSRCPATISSMCAVFAETEIIGLLASGALPADIVAGVQASIASRTAALAGRRATAPVVFTGGVALVPGMDAALACALDCPVSIAPDPQMTGALGAALLAARRASEPVKTLLGN